MWGAGAVLLVVGGQAQAFYWYDWPGGRRAGTTLVTPDQAQPFAVNPPLVEKPPGAPQTPTPPVGPPVPVDRTPIGPPTQTPEPSTGIIGLIGLGAAAAVRRWRAGRAK